MMATTCECTNPHLHMDRMDSDIRCFKCGDSPRGDLGGGDDRERLAYRVELNRMRVERKARGLDLNRRERLTLERQFRQARATELKEQGLTNGQIAYKMRLSTVTIRTYLSPEYAESARKSRERARAKNPDRYSERRREYAAANPERVRERKHEWAEANREHVRAYARKWRAANPEYRERERQNRANRRARAKAEAA